MRVVIILMIIAAFFNATAMCLQHPSKIEANQNIQPDQNATQIVEANSIPLRAVYNASSSIKQTIQPDRAVIMQGVAADQMTTQAVETVQTILTNQAPTTETPQEDEMTTQAVLKEEVTSAVPEGEMTTQAVPEEEVTTSAASEGQMTTQTVLKAGITTRAPGEDEMTTQAVPEKEITTQIVSKGEMITQTIQTYPMNQTNQVSNASTTLVIPPSNETQKKTLKITVTQNITKDCLDCMCTLISQCHASPRCSNGLCGKFHIGLNYWVDASGNKTVNDEKPSSNGAFIRCMRNDKCARRTVKSFMRKYAQDCNEDRFINCYDYAQIHNYVQSHPGDMKCRKDNLNHDIQEAMWKCMHTAEMNKFKLIDEMIID